MNSETKVNSKVITKSAPVREINYELVGENAAPIIQEKVLTMDEIKQQKIKEGKQRWARLMAENAQIVRGRFIFNECPGGEIGVPFQEDSSTPLKTYLLKDKQIYDLPLGVARHLNNNCNYPIYEIRRDERGTSSTGVKEFIHRTSFQPLSFSKEY